MNFKRSTIIFCLSTIILSSTFAMAQLSNGEGVNSQILWKAPGPSNFAFVESADILGHKDVSLSMIGNYYRKPLGLDIGGNVYWSVKRVSTVDFSWAVGLIDRVQLGMALPVIIEQFGQGAAPLDSSTNTSSDNALATAAVGDMRFYAKTLIYQQKDNMNNRGAGIALNIALSAPSGDENNFAGERGIVFAPNLIFDFKHRLLSAGTNIGARLRSGNKSVLADASIGNQLTYGLATTLHLFKEKLLIGGETTLLAEMDNFDRIGLELRGGIGTKPRETKSVTLWFTGSAGIASKDEPLLAVPQMRFTLGLTYTPSKDEAVDDIFF